MIISVTFVILWHDSVLFCNIDFQLDKWKETVFKICSFTVETGIKTYFNLKYIYCLLTDSKSIQLQVIGFENLYSMQLVKCVLCKNKEASQVGSDLKESDIEDKTEGDVPPSKKSRDDDTCNERLVMFPASQSEQLNLQIGSQFKIFPPW
jgi:hypothetical protein